MRESISRLRSNAGVATVTLGCCLALVLILGQGRGIWLDEASSFWLSAHDAAFATLWRERWITDVHPPLYSAYAWLLRPLFGGSVQEMRLINLAGLLYAALVWREAWRSGRDRDFLLVFAVLVASSPFFILYVAEFRSYFLQLVLGACLIVQLRRVQKGHGGLPLLATTALLLINLHYFGSLVGFILLGAFAVELVREGRWRDATILLLIILLAGAPLAASLLVMLATIEPVAVNMIPAGRGLMAILTVAVAAVLPNLAAMTLVLLGGRSGEGSTGRFAVVLAWALGAIAAAYFLLNLVTQNLLPRHMIAAVPIGAALVAMSLASAVSKDRRAFLWICANAVLLAVAATAYGLVNKRWESNVERVEAALAACPQSRLYALNAMSLLPAADRLHSVTGIHHVFGLTYRLIARDIGVDLMVLPEGRPAWPAGGCPALLWAEHLYVRPGISDRGLVRAAGFGGDVVITRLQREPSRALLAIRPAK